jgi:serine/threonine protein kinase
MAADFAKVLDSRKYEYVSTLGAGAFGVVVKANHVPLGVPVAVKILHAEASNTPEAVERFQLEAQAAARLSAHPNIAEVLDYGTTEDGRPFMSMRYLEGRSLEQEVRERSTLPAHEAIDIILQVLAALEAAHKLGLVHRDVKPGNIFLADGPSGKRAVKLLDFGIAKIVQGDGTIKPRSKDTTDGSVLGSPAYFAPEQARGRMHEVDARTDLYAVGGVLFRMLVGSTPFQQIRGDTPEANLLALMQAHVLQPPPHLSERSDIPFPAALDAVIQKAMEKDRSDRFGNAARFAAALRSISGAELLALRAPVHGTVPIEHQRIKVEVEKRQREKEAREAAGQRRTVRMKDEAQAQELDRLRKQSGWRGDVPPPPKGSTVPMGAGAPRGAFEGLAVPVSAPRPKRGFSRRETVFVGVLLGVAVALLVIALLLHSAK